jgi:hypothetical protein
MSGGRLAGFARARDNRKVCMTSNDQVKTGSSSRGAGRCAGEVAPSARQCWTYLHVPFAAVQRVRLVMPGAAGPTQISCEG